MEKGSDLEVKYEKLAAEYSKVRSQATVLKKAVIDEQGKNNTLKDTLKNHEQKIRKHDQEMESLIFRNEQLTKRITVLQQELQVDHTSKKGKLRPNDLTLQQDFSVVDEELQKRILENAQLVSSMVDKDYELNELKERNSWLETKLNNLQKEFEELDLKYQGEIIKKKSENKYNEETIDGSDSTGNNIAINKTKQQQEEIFRLREEVERWQTECNLLRSKPEASEHLNNYYESQLGELLENRQLAQSETKALSSENTALYKRLEESILINKTLQLDLEQSKEELLTTTENYKSQFDAMTEHLAAQNDKITNQCDEIQTLKHKLSIKK